jgi:hypothetical protein
MLASNPVTPCSAKVGILASTGILEAPVTAMKFTDAEFLKGIADAIEVMEKRKCPPARSVIMGPVPL